MAFTEGEKYKIIRFLGHNGGVLTPSNIHYSKQVSDKLTNVPEGAETEAREILQKIIALDGKQSTSINQAGVKRIDDIEFFENGGATSTILNEKRRLIRELESLLGIPFCGPGGSMGSVCLS